MSGKSSSPAAAMAAQAPGIADNFDLSFLYDEDEPAVAPDVAGATAALGDLEFEDPDDDAPTHDPDAELPEHACVYCGIHDPGSVCS